jgi:thioesterase domain-containing protein
MNASDLAAQASRLQQMLHAQFPLTRAMGLRVHTWDGARLELACPLAPNVNAHQTAFAGSQFALAALCGWSLVHLLLERHGVDASILFVNADIGYQRPLTGDLVACCDAALHPEVEDEIARAAGTGKSRLRLTVTIDAATPAAAVAGGTPPLPASVLHGTYSLRRRDA